MNRAKTERRPAPRWGTLLAAALLASLLAGCGGDDDLSAEDYGERLDTACRQYQAEVTALPQTVRDEDLSFERASELAEEASARFEDEIRDLDPPDELREDHDALLAHGEEQPPSAEDREALRSWALEFAEIYESLGATECAEGQRRAAEGFATTGS